MMMSFVVLRSRQFTIQRGRLAKFQPEPARGLGRREDAHYQCAIYFRGMIRWDTGGSF
jgi:hypothetical protein